MENDQEVKYNILVTRMDGSKEQYKNLTDNDFIIEQNLLSININGEGVRLRQINMDTVKEFDVFKY